MEPSDEALMKAYQQGDAEAMDTLIRRHASPLFGYLVRMTRDPTAAEDLFQETFLRVSRKRSSFSGSGPFKSWLFSIATNVALDAIRRRDRRPTEVSLDDEEPALGRVADLLADRRPGPAAETAQNEQAALVREAVDGLPPRQRAALMLAFFEGLTYPEVARSMGCAVGTVKTQISRALVTLAGRLPTPSFAAAPGGDA